MDDLRAALASARRPEVHEPASGTEPTAVGREHEHRLADRERMLRGLLGPIEEALKARRLLLIRTDDKTGGEPGVPGLAAARLANLISPGMTPDEQQHVLETYDLAGMTPPGRTPWAAGNGSGARGPVSRLLQCPHSTTAGRTLEGLDRASSRSKRTGPGKPGGRRTARGNARPSRSWIRRAAARRA